jgi:hypothetical protein
LAAAVTELESKLTACSSETERARQLAEERAESLTRAHDGVCERWRGVCAEDASKQLGLAAAVTELETKLAACHAREGQLEQQAHDLIAREQLLRDQLVKLEANAASAEQQLMAKVKLLEAQLDERKRLEHRVEALAAQRQHETEVRAAQDREALLSQHGAKLVAVERAMAAELASAKAELAMVWSAPSCHRCFRHACVCAHAQVFVPVCLCVVR